MIKLHRGLNIKTIINFLLFSVLYSFNLYANTYVNSEEDFYLHMKNHVNNVQRMGAQIIAILEERPISIKYFSNMKSSFALNSRIKILAKKFLQVHDASKINIDPAFLEENHIAVPGVKRLYPLYGKSFGKMTEAERAIINEQINGVDSVVRNKFIVENYVTPEEMNFLDQLEKYADLTERGSNPVTSEEIGKKAYLASRFLEENISKNKSLTELIQLKNKIKFSKKLELLYPKVAMPYEKYHKNFARFKAILSKAGITPESMRDFSEIEMYDHYIRTAKMHPDLDSKDVIAFVTNKTSNYKSLILGAAICGRLFEVIK
jgi:hypothetical protein